MGSRHFDGPPSPGNDVEILSSFIRQYYASVPFIPSSVLLADLPEETDLLESWLGARKGRRVRLHRPRRGEKFRLLELARQNAANALKEKMAARAGERDLLTRLQKHLAMARMPRRIECIDNSNTAGTAPVSARVVFVDGRAEKSAYRTYGIETVTGPDDYATMAEVLRRRFRDLEAEPLPDLMLMDGGRGQLGTAVTVLREMGLDGRFTVAGIAKKDEARGEPLDRIFLPGRVNPVQFGRDGDLLLFFAADSGRSAPVRHRLSSKTAGPHGDPFRPGRDRRHRPQTKGGAAGPLRPRGRHSTCRRR